MTSRAEASEPERTGGINDPGTAAPTTEAVPPEKPTSSASRHWQQIDTVACVLLASLALLLVGLHLSAYRTLSPIDEFQHIDYAIKAGRFEIPRRGDLAGQEVMAEAACRGIDAPGFVTPQCGLGVYEPEDFPELGINTAASQLPPYYVITGLSARAIVSFTPISSQVTAARLTGAFWLAAAASLTWYAMSLLGVARRARFIVSVLVLSTPLVVFHSATVNADVVLMFSGALVLVAAILYDRAQLSITWLLAAVIGALLLEPTNVLIAGVVGAFLTIRISKRTDLAGWRRFAPVSLIPLAALLQLEVIGRIQDSLFPRSGSMSRAPMFQGREKMHGVNLSRLLNELSSTFTPVQRAYLPPFMRTSATLAVIVLTNWLLIGAIFHTALGSETRQNIAWWSRILALALLAAGPFYTFYYAYFSNVDFPAPGRFALPLVPLLMIVAAAALRTRAALGFATVVAAASLASMTFHLLS
jgi:hypothetical protein